MNNDDTLRELLSQKMAEVEAPVDPSIWNAIGSQLPSAGAASAGAGGFAMGSKLLWVAAVVGAAAITTLAVVLSSDEDGVNPPNSTQTTTAITDSAEGEKEDQTKPDEQQPELVDESTSFQAEGRQSENTEENTRQLTVIADHDDPAVDSIEYETIYERQPKESPVSENDESLSDASQTDALGSQEREDSNPPTLQPAEGLSAQFEVSESTFEDLSFYFTPNFPDAERYIWFFGDGSRNEDVAPFHEFEEPGTYTVSLDVFDKNGFSKHYERTVEAHLPAKLVLPNTFTPNGDGYNDYLNIAVESRGVEVVKMLIYSQQGELLYEQVGQGNGWDGVHPMGDPCETGNYLMIVQAISERGEVFNEQKTVRLQR